MTNNKLIKVSGSIVIKKDTESVFDFFANPYNDNLWRAEINESKLDGILQSGVTVSEYSYLSKKAPNNLLEMKCIQFDKNKIVIFETTDRSNFYLKSQRRVHTLSPMSTEVTYSLDFDKSIVRLAAGYNLPDIIITLKAKSDLKKYLRQLKKQVEKI